MSSRAYATVCWAAGQQDGPKLRTSEGGCCLFLPGHKRPPSKLDWLLNPKNTLDENWQKSPGRRDSAELQQLGSKAILTTGLAFA